MYFILRLKYCHMITTWHQQSTNLAVLLEVTVADDPSGILNLGKTRKNIHTGFFEPYNFPKGWGQVSNKYIQHIYSYSTLSNYSKAQHGRGNEFANTIGTHQ